MLVSDLELQREGPSYTALTLEALHREGFSPSQLFFITGSDAFAEVGTWYDYPRVLQLANFVVVSRPGAPRVSDLIPNPQSLIPDCADRLVGGGRHSGRVVHRYSPARRRRRID